MDKSNYIASKLFFMKSRLLAEGMELITSTNQQDINKLKCLRANYKSLSNGTFPTPMVATNIIFTNNLTDAFSFQSITKNLFNIHQFMIFKYTTYYYNKKITHWSYLKQVLPIIIAIQMDDLSINPQT